jgi:hypothetical protein
MASSMASAMASADTTAAPSGEPGKPMGTCNKKPDSQCEEYLGAIPLGAEDSCKMLSGVFSKDIKTCSTDKMVGVCKTEYSNYVYYKYAIVPDGGWKQYCEQLRFGKWTASAAATTAGSAAVKPAAKPAGKK